MNIVEAQNDMRHSYLGGAPGVLISGLIWFTTSIVAYYYSAQTTIIVFFLGGMLIHPIGIVLSKILNRSGKHNSNNPLGKLALESTVLLFVGLFLAYTFFKLDSHLFFPIMLLIIGSRYLLFQSIYGMKVYWVLGSILIFSGFATIMFETKFEIPVLVGGLIELIVGIGMLLSERKSTTQKT